MILDLYGNNIGAEGTQYIGKALKNNTVSYILYSSIFSSFLFNIDAYDSEY